MQITEIKVFPVGEEKLRAFVSVVFDHCFMVNDIKVIQGREGMFISMPSRRKKNGRFKDIAHPLNNETRQMMEAEILSEYEEVVNGNSAGERQTATLPEDAALPPQAAPKTTEEEKKSEEPEDGKSLEEVTELHLQDSYWTT